MISALLAALFMIAVGVMNHYAHGPEPHPFAAATLFLVAWMFFDRRIDDDR